MITIPEELVDQFDRGNVLLFIGDRILRDPEAQIVIDQLAADLAARSQLDKPEEATFAEAAQAYEDAMGRQALVQFVRDKLEALGDEPQPVHRLIASLSKCKVMVITCLDRRLERAFEEAGRPLDVIIGNVDLAFEDERKTQLYKLRGSLERPESLVLTADDYESFFDDQASISVVLQGYLARKTILFVGYDLDDPHFRRLHRKVTAPLDAYARRSYAFTTTTSSLSLTGWCKRHGIELVEVNPDTFLEALADQLASRARPASSVASPSAPPAERPAVPLPERPYKLLDYYDTRDAAIFYGREQEIQALTSLIHAHRLVLLYGASGTGKTSLLLAGVVPRLEQADPPYETLYVRVRGLVDPVETLRTAVRRRLPDRDLPQDGSLVDFLAAVTKILGKTLVIFLDQFEEFFIQCSAQSRQAFSSELGELYDARDVPVKIVFSLREDWLASVNEIRQRVPEIFNINLRLLPLTRQAARQAVTAPAEQLGMTYDPTLVERLLDDLVAQQTGESQETTLSVRAGESAVVMPPQLQLVCDALYEQARTQRRKRIIVADYQAVGGAQGVLAGYIEQALQKHPGQEREVARRVLMALVTSQATKAWADLKTIAASAGAEEPTVERVLDRLAGQRLVRRLDDGRTYELAHDILAATIASWLGEEGLRLKQVQELLRRELSDWQQDSTVLLSQSKFERINAVRDSLRPTGEEAAFLLRAAVLYDEDVRYWLDRVSGTDVQMEILLDMLGGKATQGRLNAAYYLAGFPQDRAATALAHTALEDPEPAVRDMAATSLGRMRGQAGIKLLTDAVLVGESRQRALATRALALIQDSDRVASDQLTQMTRRVRLEVDYALARIRLSRNWPRIRAVTVGGAIGGAFGFALGLTPAVTLRDLEVYRGSTNLTLELLNGLIYAALGLLAGAGTGFGISACEALLGSKARMGRVLGGVLFGGLSFAVGLCPLGDNTSSPHGVLAAFVAGGLFGMMIGAGITVPAALIPKRAVALFGGAVGGVLGAIVLRTLGLPLLSDARAPVLLIGAGLLGLILSFSITRAETRWASRGKQERAWEGDHPLALTALSKAGWAVDHDLSG